jgi:hypothetical protein
MAVSVIGIFFAGSAQIFSGNCANRILIIALVKKNQGEPG